MEAQSARALELKSMPAKQQKNWEVRALKTRFKKLQRFVTVAETRAKKRAEKPQGPFGFFQPLFGAKT